MVDEIQYEEWYEKYRFTLAHELAHFVMHESLYTDLHFNSVDEHIKWRKSISPEIIDWFEYQGDAFAGHPLVPTAQLEDVCKKVVKEHRSLFENMDSIPDDVWSFISNEVARYFDVNAPVADIRIRKEGIPELIRLR